MAADLEPSHVISSVGLYFLIVGRERDPQEPYGH
jgi:hypothetical protein